MVDHKEAMAAIDRQNKEFNALRDLQKQFSNLCSTPIVDDDYPEMRHYYESSLRRFIQALKDNGRQL